MVRTQIQFPSELYGQLQKLADMKEWTLAETVRRAAEMFISVHPQIATPHPTPWKMPEPINVGEIRVREDKWKELIYGEYLSGKTGK